MPYEEGPLPFKEAAGGNAENYEDLRRELAVLISASYERWQNFDTIKDCNPKSWNARVELYGGVQKMFETLEKIGKILKIEPDEGEGSGSIEIGESILEAIINDESLPKIGKPGWEQVLLQYNQMCADKDGLMWFISEAQACITFRGGWDEMDAQLQRMAAEKEAKKSTEGNPDEGPDSYSYDGVDQSRGLDKSGEEPQVGPRNE